MHLELYFILWAKTQNMLTWNPKYIFCCSNCFSCSNAVVIRTRLNLRAGNSSHVSHMKSDTQLLELSLPINALAGRRNQEWSQDLDPLGQRIQGFQLAFSEQMLAPYWFTFCAYHFCLVFILLNTLHNFI